MRSDITIDAIIEKVKGDEDIHFLADIVATFACSTETLYRKFPTDSKEMDLIKAELFANRARVKIKLRKMFLDPESSPSEKISLYKLLGSQDERDALNGKSKQEETETISQEFEIINNQYED